MNTIDRLYARKFKAGGFSLAEILIVVVGAVLVAGGAYSLFRGTTKMSEKGTMMMDYYQKAQKIIMRLARDLKEANYVSDDAPILVPANKITTLAVSPETQKIEIVKQTPKFSQKPTGADKHVMFDSEVVTYKVEPMPGSGDYKLVRKAGSGAEEVVADKIKELLFYRVDDSDAAAAKKVYGTGSRTIYVRLTMAAPSSSNIAGASGFSVEIKTALSLRGCRL